MVAEFQGTGEGDVVLGQTMFDGIGHLLCWIGTYWGFLKVQRAWELALWSPKRVLYLCGLSCSSDARMYHLRNVERCRCGWALRDYYSIVATRANGGKKPEESSVAIFVSY